MGVWIPSSFQWWLSPHLQHQQHPANLGPRVTFGEGVLPRAGGCGAPFLQGKIQLQWKILPGTHLHRGDVHSPGQWHRAWQGHRWYLGYIHAMCQSPSTVTSCGQQGSFPPFEVSGMWLKGVRPKWGYKPVSPHLQLLPEVQSQGRLQVLSHHPSWVAGPALVTCLCVPQPHQIIFQEFV